MPEIIHQPKISHRHVEQVAAKLRFIDGAWGAGGVLGLGVHSTLNLDRFRFWALGFL